VPVHEVDLRVGQPDEMRVSVGADPLLNLINAVHEMFGPGRQRLPAAVTVAADRLARNIDLTPLRPIVAMSASSAGLPCFVAAPPKPGFTPMSEALDRLRDAPTDVIVEELEMRRSHARHRDTFADWLARPRHHLTALVAALSVFERAVFRPLVPRFETRLRIQVENIAVAIGTGQGPALLSTIHPGLSRVDDKLQWHSYWSGDIPAARSMVIYPMAASTGLTITTFQDHFVELHDVGLGLTVPALALRDVPRGAPPDHDAPLKALLGPVRSSVLSAIAAGAGHTTKTLSVQLQLSPSNVSYHLTALRKADLVDTERTGANVVYRATAAGHRILTAWS
jgi:DNA-binding transcriptional ArsR family regulator